MYGSYINTRLFYGPLYGTTRVSRYQKAKTSLDFTEARDSEWQWNPLGHMQVCTSLQTDSHAYNSSSVFTGQMPFLPPNQQCQSTHAIYVHHTWWSGITVKSMQGRVQSVMGWMTVFGQTKPPQSINLLLYGSSKAGLHLGK